MPKRVNYTTLSCVGQPEKVESVCRVYQPTAPETEYCVPKLVTPVTVYFETSNDACASWSDPSETVSPAAKTGFPQRLRLCPKPIQRMNLWPQPTLEPQ